MYLMGFSDLPSPIYWKQKRLSESTSEFWKTVIVPDAPIKKLLLTEQQEKTVKAYRLIGTDEETIIQKLIWDMT